MQSLPNRRFNHQSILTPITTTRSQPIYCHSRSHIKAFFRLSTFIPPSLPPLDPSTQAPRPLYLNLTSRAKRTIRKKHKTHFLNNRTTGSHSILGGLFSSTSKSHLYCTSSLSGQAERSIGGWRFLPEGVYWTWVGSSWVGKGCVGGAIVGVQAQRGFWVSRTRKEGYLEIEVEG